MLNQHTLKHVIDVNTSWIKTVSEQQQQFAKAAMDRLSTHIAHLNTINTPKEFIESQNDYLKDHLELSLAHAKTNLNHTIKQLDELLACVNKKPAQKQKKK